MKRLWLCLLLLAGACGGNSEPDTVRLLAHDFFAVSPDVLESFTSETGIEVEILLGGDAGLMVNQAVLSAGNPVADVIFGVDTTLLSRALDGDLFHEYESPNLSPIPAEFAAGPSVTPIDYGDVCVNFDIGSLRPTPPEELIDLADPLYDGMLVVEDPTLSTPGLAFMLATIAEFGEQGGYTWRDYWAALRDNDVLIASDWGTAYYGHFSGAGDGDRPLVVSYASSPGAELLFSDPPPDQPSTATMTSGCFRQVEYAGVLRGARNPQGAEALIDFMLGVAFQEDVPGSMFVYPVNPEAALPDWIGEPLEQPDTMLSPAEIDANRDRWLAEWSDTVLR
jgi:thiamine transport system substrate-binding protein